MAINTHGVTPTMVLNNLPFASGTVTSTSTGLNTVMITEWITEASGILNSLLQKHAMAVDNLTEEAEVLVISGIKAYACARALARREYPDAQINLQMTIFNEVKKTIRETPADLGDAQNTSASIVTNIPAVAYDGPFFGKHGFKRF